MFYGADRIQLGRIEAKLDALLTREQKVTAQITAFQTQMQSLAGQLGTDFDQIKTEEDALKAQIADLQAKQDAGTFGPDDQAALDATEKQYADLVTRASSLVAAQQPPPATTSGATS